MSSGHTLETGGAASGSVEVVIPVFNEDVQLEGSIHQLSTYLGQTLDAPWSIVIADNASTDDTWRVAQGLEQMLPRIRAVHLDEKGRGRALKHVWLGSKADVLAYMDVDLSTGLDAFGPLVAPLLSRTHDIAIGSRHLPESKVQRRLKREIPSRAYKHVLRAAFPVTFFDAQCGFKAITATAARDLLPDVQNTTWFFDSELLLLATHRGYRIHEVPVDWVDDPDSRVVLIKYGIESLRGLWRMRRSLDRSESRRARPTAAGVSQIHREPEVRSDG
jgi:glycosyltransferase involved in cell wall biosynthesis